MYIVFDNTFQIGAFCTSSAIDTRNCTDQMLDWPDKKVHGLTSQFEGITYNSLQDTYFLVQEAIPIIDDKKNYQPNIFEVRIFENNSNMIHQKTGKTYLFGLCEANKCASWMTDKDLGKGRIVILEKKESTKKSIIYSF
jgi:hypothetical protein